MLGVKPGVSDRELKAAHRDLAKVWHPDRFLHDPRLQEKAQEKLKEINDAYEQLTSRHKRPTQPRRSPARANTTSPVRTRRGAVRWQVIVPVAVFTVVFSLTTKTLLRERSQRAEQNHSAEATQIDESSAQSSATTAGPGRANRNRTENSAAPVSEVVNEPAPTPQTVSPVRTVTVSIDPANGLLATPDCPVKTRVTYPTGSEPHAYCNVTHVVKTQKPAGFKGLAKRIL